MNHLPIPRMTRSHWESVYLRTSADKVSWFQESATTSLKMIDMVDLGLQARILDVGGGASRLADGLLNAGYSDVTVLDIAGPAIAAAKTRLGERAELIAWIEADVLEFEPETTWDLWHDRAVFHFLISQEERDRYRTTMGRALKPGGHVIIATFGPSGPERCSGLPVVRYDPEALAGALGPGVSLCHTELEQHTTPTGQQQEFLYCWLQLDS